METQIKKCQNCRKDFRIEPDDFTFYEKIKVPPPTFCPECRFVRRLAMRNERSLYKRKCDLCGEEKILIFPAGSFFKVYCFNCWWSDKWSPESYAKDYDFNRPFFEQFKELFLAVPRLGIIQQGFNVQSDYTNRVSDNKNCYLIFASANNENCAYGASIWNCKECMDGYNLHQCEQCYECINCHSSSGLKYSEESINCLNSAFLQNCRNCSDCFGCVNLRNKSYCIWNEQYSKEDYQAKLKQLDLSNRLVVAEMRRKLDDLARKYILPAMLEYKTAASTGNWLEECKDVRVSFNSTEVEEGKYLFGVNQAKDVMDYTYWGKGSELMYSSASVGRQCADVKFSNESWDQLIRAEYCTNCHGSSDLFGCIGLRKKQYCVLNKQYSKEEYEALIPKIKAQMQAMPYKDEQGRTYGYGEFFPAEITTAPYNESIAQEYFPTTEERARAQGYRWSKPEKKTHTATLKAEDVPYALKDAGDILRQTIECQHRGECQEQCTGAFRLTQFELDLYQRLGIALPQLCPNCRHFARLRRLPVMRLAEMRCRCAGETSEGGEYLNSAKHFHGEEPCPNTFQTTYAPEKIVYCLQCYNSEIA